MAEERIIPAPPVNPESKPYWDACAEGKLLVKHCTACGKAHHYPRTMCPFCFSDKTEFRPAKGTGEIYSFSVVKRGPPIPYAIAYVTLAEGPKMMTNIVDCDLDSIKVGQKVKLVFKPVEDGSTQMPMFTPA